MAQTATLTRAALEAHDPTGGKGGRWLCPLPGICAEHTDPRRHRSLTLEDSTGLWQCWRCHHQGQLKESWKPFERKTWKEKEQEATQRRRVGLARILAKHSKPEDPHPAAGQEWRLRLGQLVKLNSAAGRAGLRYVQGRGFTTPDALALLDAAGVRFSSTFGQREATDDKRAWRGAAAVVFPVRDHHGGLTAAQGRMVAPAEGMPKVLTFGDRNRGAFATPGALEALEAGLPVAISEAPFDALTLALCGLPALALCGCSGLPEWITRRAFNRRFLLAFDADEAGDTAAEKLGLELRGLGGMVSRLKPASAKDWNEALQSIGPDALRAELEREAVGSPATGDLSEMPPAPSTMANPGLTLWDDADHQKIPEKNGSDPGFLPPWPIEHIEYQGKLRQLDLPPPGRRGPRDASGKLLPLDLERYPPMPLPENAQIGQCGSPV